MIWEGQMELIFMFIISHLNEKIHPNVKSLVRGIVHFLEEKFLLCGERKALARSVTGGINPLVPMRASFL